MRQHLVFLLIATNLFFSCKKNPSRPPVDCPSKPAIGVAVPTPIDLNNKLNTSQIDADLKSMKAAIPSLTYSFLVFYDQLTDTADWKAVLDVYSANNIKAIVAFYDYDNNEALKPLPVSPGNWNTGSLEKFIQSDACINHPAVMAVAIVDEPFEYLNTKLQRDLYLYCKSLNPLSDFQIMVNHSRQLWKKVHTSQGGKGADPEKIWMAGLCDMVNISTLEFGMGRFDVETLDSNHLTSRQLIKNITPGLPLYTTVQTFGTQYSPANVKYYFPGPDELTQMLDLLTDDKYQGIYPLSGITFQRWAPKVSTNSSEWVLGSQLSSGTPVTRRLAAQRAIDAINVWMKKCR